MTRVKAFSNAYSPDNAVKEATEWLEHHPYLTVRHCSTCACGTQYILTLVCEERPKPAPMPVDPWQGPQTVPLPYRPPVEITCNDPWNGEFIPVGDPPLSRPDTLTYNYRGIQQ